MSLNGTNIVMAFEPLSTSQRRGAIVVTVFALLSALALAFIALRTIRLAMMLCFKHDDSTSRPPEILFFRTQLGHYAGCLILSNMFISAAGLIDFSWVLRSGLSQGSTCSAQAVLMQIGIWGTCWFTAAHGLHTLSSLGFRIRAARWRSSVYVAIGWIIAFVAGLAPLWMSNVYGPTGSSCSITSSYPKERFVLEALPIILVAFASTALYSVIFIVLRGQLSVNSAQKLQDSNSTNQRGEDSFEEYYKFISMIIRTMFWFPLAFVLLLLPFCVTHILMYAGHAVPSALSVFADACVSMLGFVNVVLLRNTIRVISPVYHGPRAMNNVTETVKTFGHDASGESPIVPRPTFCSQSTIPSHEGNHRTYNSTRLSSGHLGSSSWASVYPIPSAEKASYESIQTKVAPPVLNGVMPPAELNRYPRIISLPSSIKRQDIHFQSKITVNSSSRTASLGPYPPRFPFVTGDARDKPSIQHEVCSFQPMANTDDRKWAKGPAFKPKVPLAMNHSRLSVPQLRVNTRSLGIADESSSRPFSSYSITSTMTDSDSDYSGEILHVSKIRPPPRVLWPSNDEQYTAGCYPLAPRRLRGQSCMSMSTVWSEESGSMMGHSSDAESQETYWPLAADMVVPGVVLGDRADVGEAMSRQSTPPGSWESAQSESNRNFRPPSRICRTSTIAFAPNYSVV